MITEEDAGAQWLSYWISKMEILHCTKVDLLFNPSDVDKGSTKVTGRCKVKVICIFVMAS